MLKANKAKGCHLIPCHSTEFDDKLAVDVIVSETLGNYALEENIIATLADARRTISETRWNDHSSSYRCSMLRRSLRRASIENCGHGSTSVMVSISDRRRRMTLNNAYVRHLQPFGTSR